MIHEKKARALHEKKVRSLKKARRVLAEKRQSNHSVSDLIREVLRQEIRLAILEGMKR